jgi:cysteine desulfurase family protein (TIGR01976 family)
MTYDVAAVRASFPALKEGVAHFDGPGGSQVPDVVGDAVASVLTSSIANRGRGSRAARRADDVVAAFRAAMADLLGAVPGGIVYGRSMTQLTYDFSRALAKTWKSGDEVVVTRLDHDANIRPWVQAAEAVGATIRWVSFDPATGELPAAAVAEVLSARTRLVAVTGASNLIGTRPPVAEIAPLVHEAGALFYVDGVHLTPHAPVDIAALGADFYTCSPYKFLGPHCGVLAARPELLEEIHPDKLLPASDAAPERFELGTLPYEMLAGTTAAVDYLASLAPDPVGSRRERLVAALAAMDGVVLHGHAPIRTPTLLFSLTATAPDAVAAHLAERGVNAPAGSFYALEAARVLGIGAAGAVRAGIAPYTDDDDADRLVAGVAELLVSA